MKTKAKKAVKKQPKQKRECVACGKEMSSRPNGAPWHKKCGEAGGME